MANAFDRIISRLSGLNGREAKVSAAGSAIVGTTVGTAQWPDRNYENFAKEAYTRNAIGFHCISMIAQAGCSIPILLEDKKTRKQIDDSDHPLLKLLDRPAPQMTGVELFERTISFLKIAGNGYVEQVGPDRKGAPPIELYSHRPDRMKVIAGRDAVAAAFEYEANGRRVRWDVDPITGASKIMHLKSFNPLNDWYGMSAVDPAAFSIDQHNESAEHNMAILQNGAVPSGGLVFKPVTVDGSQQFAPETILKAAELRLEERHKGAKHAGRPMVLGGNIEWQQFGLSLEQLQMIESKRDAAWDTCIAFGVPPILVLQGQSTYNNNREAKLALYEETIMPLMEWLIDHMNIWLTPAFGDNLRLILDLDSVDALSPRREEKRKTFVELFSKRVINRTEFREGLDYEPLEDMPEFDSQAHEVSAVVGLINGGKLSMDTGFKQLAKWGILPADIDAQDEKDKIDQESGGIDGTTGVDDPSIDPITGKPKPSPKPLARPVPAPKPPAVN